MNLGDSEVGMGRAEPLELVYFQGCPSVEAARVAMRGALGVLGLPARLRAFPSPTVLVRGRDVLGDGPITAARACRAGEVATPEIIAAALKQKLG
jgi:hypothetical protein